MELLKDKGYIQPHVSSFWCLHVHNRCFQSSSSNPGNLLWAVETDLVWRSDLATYWLWTLIPLVTSSSLFSYLERATRSGPPLCKDCVCLKVCVHSHLDQYSCCCSCCVTAPNKEPGKQNRATLSCTSIDPTKFIILMIALNPWRSQNSLADSVLEL